LILRETILRTLPIGPTISHMLSSTMNNLGFALRAQWPWVVVMAAIFAFIGLTTNFPSNGTPAENEVYFREHPGQLGWFVFVLLIGILVAMLAFSSIAVAWHRYVLLDEVPQGMAKLRLDGTVWRYFGNLILIGLLLMVAALPLTILVGLLIAANPVLGIIGALVYSALVMLPVIYRLSIKLPAIALERKDFRMGDAWKASAGNWWQIVGVGLGVTVLSWIVGLVMFAVSKLFSLVLGDGIGFWFDLALQAGVNWVLTIMGITLLTSMYGYFVEKRDF
jgi:hypothetical protein